MEFSEAQERKSQCSAQREWWWRRAHGGGPFEVLREKRWSRGKAGQENFSELWPERCHSRILARMGGERERGEERFHRNPTRCLENSRLPLIRGKSESKRLAEKTSQSGKSRPTKRWGGKTPSSGRLRSLESVAQKGKETEEGTVSRHRERRRWGICSVAERLRTRGARPGHEWKRGFAER